MASFSDDFNRADSSNLGTDWVEVTGDWSIISNQLSSGSAGGTIILRAVPTMASNDHYVQATIAATASVSQGIWCRGNSNITNGYLFRNDGSSWNLFWVVGGSFNVIGTYSAAAANGDVARLECVGSSIKCFINGVQRISVTDTAVPAGTSVGIRSESISTIRFDNFTAADITAGVTLGIAAAVDTAQPLTAGKTAALGTAATTETAQPVAGTKSRALSTAASAEAPQPLQGAKAAALPVAAAQESAQPLTGSKAAALGAATASETARPLMATKTVALGTAMESGAAQPLTVPSGFTLGTATETGTSRPLAGAKSAALAAATATETAQALAGTVSRLLGAAAAVEAARPLFGAKTTTLGTAIEISTTRPLTAPSTSTPSQERTYRIPAEDRRRTILAEPRTHTIRR